MDCITISNLLSGLIGSILGIVGTYFLTSDQQKLTKMIIKKMNDDERGKRSESELL